MARRRSCLGLHRRRQPGSPQLVSSVIPGASGERPEDEEGEQGWRRVLHPLWENGPPSTAPLCHPGAGEARCTEYSTSPGAVRLTG
ncbi:unnamed protein product [Lota lota]